MKTIDRLVSVVLIAMMMGISCELPLGDQDGHAVRPVEIVEAQLGSALRADKTIPDRRLSAQFRPDDTVHLALRIFGEGPEVPLRVRWYFGERLVEETHRIVAPHGLSRTSFHYRRSEGMTHGSYQVVVLLDGKEAKRLLFEVRPVRS